MTSLQGFKKFAKIRQPPVEAKRALGVLTLRRQNTTPPLQSIAVAKGAAFSTHTQSFTAVEAVTLSESASFVPCAVQAAAAGLAGNIAAAESWSSSIPNLSISNEAAFSGGAEAVEGLIGAPTEWDMLDDSTLQDFIDTAKSIVLKKLAAESLPDNGRVDRSVYLLAQYMRQQRTFQERQRKLDAGEAVETETEYWRGDRVWQALMIEIDNLLASDTDVLAFMPEGDLSLPPSMDLRSLAKF